MSVFFRIKIWARVIRAYLLTFSGVKSNVLDGSETVDVILNGKSLIRLGDGEFGIFAERDIHYQPFSTKLKKEFEHIKTTYEQEGNDCRFLLAVPKKFMQCSGVELGKKRVYISSWSDSRLFFKKYFNRSLVYGDAFLFEKRNKETYSRIWSQPGDNRTIIFVHNNERYAESFGQMYNREVIFVQCPPFDAFSKTEKILADVNLKINDAGLQRNDVQIVISAGPAGKVLVYHLSKSGFQCIDAGHCWDDPLES